MNKLLPPIKLNNPGLLLQALTHRSSLNEKSGSEQSYERLEFLGDAVLELVISAHLIETYPKHPEGELTHIRANLVQTKTLAEAALRLKLNKYLILSKGETRSGGSLNPSLLADCFEAVIGAIYLDQGLESAKKFISKNLIDLHKQLIEAAQVTDYKSILQELWQKKYQTTPVYKIISATVPDHNKKFSVAVYLKGKVVGQGPGKSKQEAQQQAAKAALEK